MNAIDRFCGTWVLDAAASRYAGRYPPRSAIQRIEAVAGGVVFGVLWEDTDGVEHEAQFNLRFDDPGNLGVAWAPDGALVSVVRRDGAVIARTRRELDADALTMTVTQSTAGADGTWREDVSVYRRSAAPIA